MYIDTTCYVYTPATCITLNEQLADTKIYFAEAHNVFTFQKYSLVEVRSTD